MKRYYIEQKKLNRHISVISSILLILLAAVLAMSLFIAVSITQHNKTKNTLENVYQKSLYDMSDGLNSVEMKLSKLLVASGKTQILTLSNDIWKETGAIESNLSALPLDHYAVTDTSKFINQLGDYINSLNKKVQNSQTLTDEETETLSMLYYNCKKLNDEMQDLSQKVKTTNYKISQHITKKNKKDTDIIGENFTKINDSTIDYPEMIYDGPFSDAVKNKTYKSIEDEEEITAEEGTEYIKEKFTDTASVDYRGEAGGDLATYEYIATTNEGRTRYIQLTQKGGLPIMISGDNSHKEPVLSDAEAIFKAQKWAEILLEEEMQGVWICNLGTTAVINLAPVKNNVILYPDLIKVKVCMSDGALLGWEADAYLQNHTDRDLDSPAIDQSQAAEKVSGKISIDSVRLTLIPKDNDKEVLCYEFNGFYNESNYIIYINALSGEEENILKVIKTGIQGNMLM